MGYCIIIVANIINMQAIDISITWFPCLKYLFSCEKPNAWMETAAVHLVFCHRWEDATIESYSLLKRFLAVKCQQTEWKGFYWNSAAAPSILISREE